MIKAKFITTTSSGRSRNLDRWECPNCRAKKAPECRFNLSSKKRGQIHQCRFCKTSLELDPKNK